MMCGTAWVHSCHLGIPGLPGGGCGGYNDSLFQLDSVETTTGRQQEEKRKWNNMKLEMCMKSNLSLPW